jgi:phosphoglycerate dehydrogenase-like enzyme
LIVSTEKLPRKALDLLTDWQVREERPTDETLGNAEILMTWPSKVTREILSRAKKLRAIQFLSAGVDDVPFPMIPANVRLFSNADAFSISVAEHAWALVMALGKGLCGKERAESRIVSGRTLGVLGCGGIGSEVAKIGRGMNMRVLGLSRSFRNPEFFDEKYHDASQVDVVMDSADVVVCTLPVNKSTRNLLKYENLKHLKEACIIVNVSRAEVFDEDGLLKFLKERPETRFGTDVFWRKDGKEKFDSKLWSLSNFIGTRHTAGLAANSEVRDNSLVHAAENVATFLKSGRANNEIITSDYI